MSRAAALLLALLWVGSAAAQTPVYRCGADGRSYAQEPCAGGRAVDVSDSRSAQEAAQARQAVQRDARQALAMERARLQREREAARQGPVLIGWSRPQAAADKTGCAKDAKACKRDEGSKRRPDKGHTVTLYRGADSAIR